MSSPQTSAARTTVTVPSPEGVSSYDVWIRPGALEDLARMTAEACPAHRYAIVADSQVARIHGPGVVRSFEAAGRSATLLTFPAGEWNKTRESWSDLTDGMLKAGFGRDAAVVALGGGVTGDLAGFVAATFLRGVPVVQVPTTLLAMLDSSVGGKTGVDTPSGKNLVGAFHHPALVVIDPLALKTLPDPQLAAGLAEAFKHGLILDADYFQRLTASVDAVFARNAEILAEIIARSVRIKAEVVSRDARESGYRRVLNFGHTVAHAQEAVSGYAWLHGEAVAAGMVAEAAIGEALGVTRPGVVERIRTALEAARLPVELDSDLDASSFFRALELDKKREGGRVMYSLIRDVGSLAGSAAAGWTRAVPEEVVRNVLFEGRSGV